MKKDKKDKTIERVLTTQDPADVIRLQSSDLQRKPQPFSLNGRLYWGHLTRKAGFIITGSSKL